MVQSITLTRPDDWHVHLRDGPLLGLTVKHCAQRFARAIVMPNLADPVTATIKALQYRERIIASIPEGLSFTPLMTLYLTDNTTAKEIKTARDSGYIKAVKLYPSGATTNSNSGVTSIDKVLKAIAAIEENNLLLLIHGEVTDDKTDVFDREKVFIDKILAPLIDRFPGLRIVLEHITTKDAVEFVSSAPSTVAGTITPHHLLLNRNAILVGGIHPHYYCLPVLKRESHREALISAATSGNPKFFLGTDSAPHDVSRKESACGCAGIYSSHAALELYAEVFDQVGKLDKLEAFASHFGADFYGLPRNTDEITLTRKDWSVSEELSFETGKIVPFRSNELIHWQLDLSD
ncbi:MAG: dihydroorotase [Gammaproteobacteria bacterium]